LLGILKVALRLTTGYRFHFWDSPYLRWRLETWSGVPAESLTKKQFLEFSWLHRADLIRYLRWAANRGVVK
jgi:hypothetical protein